MTQVFLSTGSNAGDRESLLHLASKQIELKAGKLCASSSIYETAPWGNTHQPLFLNQVLEIQTLLKPEDLLSRLIDIEHLLGRIRSSTRWEERTIDIDILFYGSAVLSTPDLQVPHPELYKRRFVLTPLDELAPQFTHPVTGKLIHELLRECNDPLEVRKWQTE